MRSGVALFVACVAAVLAAGPALGQGATTEARLREALRAATARVDALEREREKQATAEAALRKELDSLRSRLAAEVRAPERPSQVAELKARLAAEVEAAANAAAKAAARLEECQAASGVSAQAAQSREDERTKLAGDVTSLRERLAQSEARNARLYAVGKDILDWLDRLGFGKALAAREPFLGLRRVELENVALEFEDKLLEQKR